MNDDIWIWHYELKSATNLNAASSRTTHPGALIHVGNGYGCIHPWPELGDLPLEKHLKSIAEGTPTQMAGISLTCAKKDGVARAGGISLFDEVDAQIPQSHWLYQQGDDISSIREKGFSTVKMKIGPSNPNIENIAKAADRNLFIRLDANYTFEFDEFRNWWKSLDQDVAKLIEFIEDPVPWNRSNWRSLEDMGVPLAVDREVEKTGCSASWSIFKPAVNLKQNLKEKLIVTSYMDHPIGQMWAAYNAKLLNQSEPEKLGECGLLTHRCFEKDEFTEQIEVDGCILQRPPGTGLGFDDLLEALPWKRLN